MAHTMMRPYAWMTQMSLLPKGKWGQISWITSIHNCVICYTVDIAEEHTHSLTYGHLTYGHPSSRWLGGTSMQALYVLCWCFHAEAIVLGWQEPAVLIYGGLKLQVTLQNLTSP